jgi:transcription initiation factor TFIIB
LVFYTLTGEVIDLSSKSSIRTYRLCPECQQKIYLSFDSSNTVCGCGAVLEEKPIDHGPEWRSFNKEKQQRTGAPRTVTRHDRGLSTKIGKGQSDVTDCRRARLNRQRILNSRAKQQSESDRNEAQGLGQIQRIGGKLSLGDEVVEEACSVFSNIQSQGLLQGRSVDHVAPASVYFSLRLNSNYRHLSEIAQVAQCSADEIRKAYKTLQRELRLPVPVLNSTDVLPSILSDLPGEPPPTIRFNAWNIAEAADSSSVNHSPKAMAGASIRIVQRKYHGEKIWTQGEIANCSNCCRLTIRSTSRELSEKLSLSDVVNMDIG